jgi:hypothetical protein
VWNLADLTSQVYFKPDVYGRARALVYILGQSAIFQCLDFHQAPCESALPFNMVQQPTFRKKRRSGRVNRRFSLRQMPSFEFILRYTSPLSPSLGNP